MKKIHYIIIVIILVGIASFGLGRMSVLDTLKPEGVEFIIPELSKIDTANKGLNYFASINGAKYYPRGCKSGNRVKTENRMYFKSTSDAEKSGFSRAANC